MNSQEKIYFDKLVKDRAININTLKKPSLKGLCDIAENQYSDQTHFIYELIQNADDTSATWVRFELLQDKLIFTHNGTRHFSISDPDTEKDDIENNKLGDVNAITSYGSSLKASDGNTIGKFGLGFKSVFNCTSTPLIYDSNILFMINNKVPELLTEDWEGRNPNETVFVFPFNQTNSSVKKIYRDILEKLKNLIYPNLFLVNIREIFWKSNNEYGTYSKEVLTHRNINDLTAEFICYKQRISDKTQNDHLWLFSRKYQSECNNYRYSVGFFLDDNHHLRPCGPLAKYAFCYFPTKVDTRLNFIIHAPFILTPSREGICVDNEQNKDLILYLAKLSADGLLSLKMIGEENGINLITDDIFDVVPIKEADFDNHMCNSISFKPFYNEILELLKTEEMLPTLNGYTNAMNGVWASDKRLTELFSDKQLAALIHVPNAKWIFRSIGSEQFNNSNNDHLYKFLLNITTAKNRLSFDQIISNLSKSFIEEQTPEWLGL